MLNIQSSRTVGEIATEHPMATRVFHRHGIDFCCGGGKPLSEICTTNGLDETTIVDEINKVISTDTSTQRWDQVPLDALIQHILITYHEPLREEMPRLEQMALKVLEVHGEKDPEMFSELVKVYVTLKTELENHMAKEEQILFPMIIAGQGSLANSPISVMESEHESAGGALRRLRELTNDYTHPDEACNTWRALWHGLGALETDLHEHIHLENNILFPRALAG